MGAKFIAGTIQWYKGIKNLNVKDDTEFRFEYQANDSTFKPYRVYAPTRDDYEVSTAVIDKAVNNGYNLIVYDHWIFATHSGKEYAGFHKIPIFSVPEFIKVIKEGQTLE